jgi:predicted ThiF/HesA family dinucleotide-utilizing enzyme
MPNTLTKAFHEDAKKYTGRLIGAGGFESRVACSIMEMYDGISEEQIVLKIKAIRKDTWINGVMYYALEESRVKMLEKYGFKKVAECKANNSRTIPLSIMFLRLR